MSIFKKNEQAIIALILVLANFLIKGIFLSSNSLGGDEPFSVYHAQMDIASIIRLLSQGNNPPLYEIFLHFWIKFFGISEFSVRFPSLIFSSLTVFYIYILGTKFLNKRIALYASIIFIFSNYHILFAHEARVYSLLGLLSIVSMYYFMNVIQYCTNDTKLEDNLKLTFRRKLIILIVINTLIIYSHYFGFFILIIQLIFIVFNKNIISKYWKQLLICSSIIGLLYSPYIFVVLNRLIITSSNGSWVEKPSGFDSIYNMLQQFSNAPVVAVFCIVILIISLVKSILNKKKEQKNIYNQLVVTWFVFVFFFMFSISYLIPMFMDRYLMPSAIAFSLVIGISLDYIIRIQKIRYLIPVIITLLFVITVKPNITNKRNVEETVEKIKSIKNSSTLVLLCPSHFVLNFIYYYDREVFMDYSDQDIYSNIENKLSLENIYNVNNIKEVDIEKSNHIIYLDAASMFSYPDNNILNTLNLNYKLVGEYKFYEIFNVYEYRMK
jgi:mannosyltransferase